MKLGLFLLTVSSSLFADFAKVKFVRGEVTALKPERVATKLKKMMFFQRILLLLQALKVL